jgi:hypothetical protein
VIVNEGDELETIGRPQQGDTTILNSAINLLYTLWVRIAIALAVAMALSACGNIEPWVKPYEREALADPIMSFDANPVSTSYTHHVFEAREGARGALGSAGGGCGCN